MSSSEENEVPSNVGSSPAQPRSGRARRKTAKAINYGVNEDDIDPDLVLSDEEVEFKKKKGRNGSSNDDDGEANRRSKPKKNNFSSFSGNGKVSDYMKKKNAILNSQGINGGNYNGGGAFLVNHEEVGDADVNQKFVQKVIYTEKNYDHDLPIRERYLFLPEFEEDGSPKIDKIIGRRPLKKSVQLAMKAAQENLGDTSNLSRSQLKKLGFTIEMEEIIWYIPDPEDITGIPEESGTWSIEVKKLNLDEYNKQAQDIIDKKIEELPISKESNNIKTQLITNGVLSDSSTISVLKDILDLWEDDVIKYPDNPKYAKDPNTRIEILFVDEKTKIKDSNLKNKESRLKAFEKENTYAFCRILAKYFYVIERDFYIGFSLKELKEELDKNKVEHSSLKKNRTFLVLTKGGNYRFAHRSIYEFFLAQTAVEDEAFDNESFHSYKKENDFASKMYEQCILKRIYDVKKSPLAKYIHFTNNLADIEQYQKDCRFAPYFIINIIKGNVVQRCYFDCHPRKDAR